MINYQPCDHFIIRKRPGTICSGALSLLARNLHCVWRMKNEQQTQVDEEMGYFFGFPKGTYSEVLRQLGQTRVNSCRTSSIPLAEFWQPANLAKIQSLFAPHLPGFDPAAALKIS